MRWLESPISLIGTQALYSFSIIVWVGWQISEQALPAQLEWSSNMKQIKTGWMAQIKKSPLGGAWVATYNGEICHAF